MIISKYSPILLETTISSIFVINMLFILFITKIEKPNIKKKKKRMEIYMVKINFFFYSFPLLANLII